MTSKEKADSLYKHINELFTGRGLSFNDDKTVIVAPGEAFDLKAWQTAAAKVCFRATKVLMFSRPFFI